jgi:hypothetical protein
MWFDRRRLGAGEQPEPKVGLVLRVKGRNATVLLPGGALERFRLEAPGARAGDEVLLPAWVMAGSRPPVARGVRATAIAVCALALALFLSGFAMYLNPLPAVAMISVDINPGVTLYVNSVMRVVSVQAVDGAGQALVEGLSLVHRPVREALGQLVERAAKDLPAETAERYLVIGASPVMPGEVLSQQFLATLDGIKEQALERLGAGQPSGSGLHGAVIAVPSDVANDAKDLGLSAGKYALVLAAQETGTDVRVADVCPGDIMAVVKAAGLKPPDLLAKANEVSLEEAWIKHRDKVRSDREPAPGSPVGGTTGQHGSPAGSGGQGAAPSGAGSGQTAATPESAPSAPGEPGSGQGPAVGTGEGKTGEPGGGRFPMIKDSGSEQRLERLEEVVDRFRSLLKHKPVTRGRDRGGR